MNEHEKFLLLRAGTVMGVGLGLGIGIGVMMLQEAIVLPHWLAAVHSNPAVIGALPFFCFLSGLVLAKRARAAE